MNNANKIHKFYIDTLTRHKKHPSREDVAQQLKIELDDVDAYHNNAILTVEEEASKFRVYTEAVFATITGKAIKGDIRAIDQYMKYIHGHTDKKRVDVTNNGNSFQTTFYIPNNGREAKPVTNYKLEGDGIRLCSFTPSVMCVLYAFSTSCCLIFLSCMSFSKTSQP